MRATGSAISVSFERAATLSGRDSTSVTFGGEMPLFVPRAAEKEPVYHIAKGAAGRRKLQSVQGRRFSRLNKIKCSKQATLIVVVVVVVVVDDDDDDYDDDDDVIIVDVVHDGDNR